MNPGATRLRNEKSGAPNHPLVGTSWGFQGVGRTSWGRAAAFVDEPTGNQGGLVSRRSRRRMERRDAETEGLGMATLASASCAARFYAAPIQGSDRHLLGEGFDWLPVQLKSWPQGHLLT